MLDHHRVVLRNLIQVVNVELAIIFNFGVVEEIPFDPIRPGRRAGFCAEFVDNAARDCGNL